MSQFYIYHTDAGRIVSLAERSVVAVNLPPPPPGLHQMHLAEVPDASPYAWVAGHMVRNGQVVARPVLAGFDCTTIKADDADCAVLTGLPEDAEARVNGAPWVTVRDGVLRFSTGVPGRYTISVRAFPFVDAEFTVEAVAP